MPARPARRRIRASLDVPRKELDTRQQTAHAPHVVIAVAADLIANAVQEQGPVLERHERLEALLELEILALLVGPERRRDDAVGTEHHHEPLLPLRLIGEPQARQVEQERQGPRADAQVSEKFASVGRLSHVMPPEECR